MKPRKYDVQLSSTFKKSRKHQPKKILALNEVIEMLACDEVLDEKYHDHKLIGTYVDCCECHIEPDLLLIYQKKKIFCFCIVWMWAHTMNLSPAKNPSKKT